MEHRRDNGRLPGNARTGNCPQPLMIDGLTGFLQTGQMTLLTMELLPPLETERIGDSIIYSDHSIQYLCSRIERKVPISWESYSYRHYNERGLTCLCRIWQQWTGEGLRTVRQQQYGC